MKDDTDRTAATPEPRPTENFQVRFNAELEKWREQGCPHPSDEDAATPCGARPHGTKISPADDEGNVTMNVACTNGHADVWQFKIAEADMKAELKRQADAAAEAEANGGKALDPMIAKVTISMNLKTQEVKIDPWVPTPGMGIQLAGMLMSHFFAQLQQMAAPQNPGGLKIPPKGIIHPKTGRLVS